MGGSAIILPEIRLFEIYFIKRIIGSPCSPISELFWVWVGSPKIFYYSLFPSYKKGGSHMSRRKNWTLTRRWSSSSVRLWTRTTTASRPPGTIVSAIAERSSFLASRAEGAHRAYSTDEQHSQGRRVPMETSLKDH